MAVLDGLKRKYSNIWL